MAVCLSISFNIKYKNIQSHYVIIAFACQFSNCRKRKLYHTVVDY